MRSKEEKEVIKDLEQYTKMYNDIMSKKFKIILDYIEKLENGYLLMGRQNGKTPPTIKVLNELEERTVLKDTIKEEKKIHEDYLANAAVTSNKALDAHFREKERYVIQVLDKLLGEDKIEKSE